MTSSMVRLNQVWFGYQTAPAAVFEAVSLSLNAGWTGVVGANGAGKTTLLRLLTGELAPTRGTVDGPGDVAYCAQRTDRMPTGLDQLIASTDPALCRLRGTLGVEPDWSDRWSSLSHGERKRAQIAVALAARPRLLAIDEPTNHIDQRGRVLLREALRGFGGIGVLVSHDRDLLDELCQSCVFLDPPRAVQRPGGYSQGLAQARLEQESREREHRRAKRQLRRLTAERATRREHEVKAERGRSRRGLAPGDHDGRARRNLARLTDGSSGQRLRQLDGRLAQAERRLRELPVTKRHRLGIELASSRSARNTLFDLPEATIPLGGGRHLDIPRLILQPDQRVALTGDNGTGKSTLLGWILDRLTLPAERLCYLPQELDADRAATLVERLRRLDPERRGAVLTVFSRLGSRPERVLGSELPSPGEARKLLLALSVADGAELLLLDEPTNHLDLPSIECLEEALAPSPAAMVLVSHDRRFLDRLTDVRWEIEADSAERTVLRRH